MPMKGTPGYKALKEQLARLTEAVEAARIKETREAIATCKSLIADFGLTAYDLGLVKTQELPPAKVKKDDKTFKATKPKHTYPPKYVNPATGVTWSGRGHQPKWIEGNRDEYLIKEPAPRATQNNRPSIPLKKGE